MMFRVKVGFPAAACFFAAAVLAGLAGFVAPMVASGNGDAKEERARSDLARIASAIEEFMDATHCCPTGTGGATTYHFLYSEGAIPRNNPLADGPGMPLSAALAKDGRGALSTAAAKSRGGRLPLRLPGADPWGHAYLVNTHGFFFGGERTFVITAGPNGEIETPPAAASARGDDILLLLLRG